MLTPFRKDRDVSRKNYDFWDMRKTLDKFFNETFLPAFFHDFGFAGIRADIRESEKEYLVEAEIPGVDKNCIIVDFRDDTLIISVRYEEGQEITESNFIQRERRTGNFSRSFYVENVDETGISASYNNGILKIVLPKSSKPKPRGRRIEVQ